MAPNKLLLIALVSIGLNQPCSAQPDDLQGMRMFFDSNTIAYARVDLEKLDVDRSLTMVGAFLSEQSQWANYLPMLAERVSSLRSKLRTAGAKDVFFILSLSDLPLGERLAPVAIVLPASTADHQNAIKAIGDEIASEEGLTCISFDGGVFLGYQRIWNRVQGRALPAREDFEELLALSEGDAISIAVSPSAETRRAIKELLPKLPEPFDRISGNLLADGVGALTMTINPFEQPSVEVRVRGDDPESNRLLGAELTQIRETLVASLSMEEQSKQVLNRLVSISQGEGDFSVTLGSSGIEQLSRSVRSAVQAVEENYLAIERANQLRELALSMHNYHDATKALPPYAKFDDDGKPLLSWRVLVLPFLEGGQELYRQFHLDEPWDSEHNRTLIGQMPDFLATFEMPKSEGKTVFVMPRGPKVIGQEPRLRLQDVKDGTSQTILLIEAPPENAVIWTKPEDWEVDLDRPSAGLFSESQSTTRAAFADGSVHTLDNTLSESLLKALLTVDGREVVEHSDLSGDR